MTCLTLRTSTANCSTDRQFRSVCTTTLATLRWTNSSPGSRPTISFAGTRLSEQPTQRNSGAWIFSSREKNVGSCLTRAAAQVLLFWSRVVTGVISLRLSHARHPGGHRSLLVDDGGLDRIDQLAAQPPRPVLDGGGVDEKAVGAIGKA